MKSNNIQKRPQTAQLEEERSLGACIMMKAAAFIMILAIAGHFFGPLGLLVGAPIGLGSAGLWIGVSIALALSIVAAWKC